MASTYSPSLRLELIGTGDQSGTWGDTTNTNLGSLLEQAITGVDSIPMLDANYTLNSLNGSVDEARNAVVNMTSAVALTASRNVIIPNVEKLYVVKNSTTGGQNLVFKTSAGVGFTVPNGKAAAIYCDGTDCYQVTTYMDSPTLATPTITGNASVSGNLFVNGTLTTGAGPYTVLNSNNYNTYAPKLDGTGATGTWNIGISGNAATATSATSATNATNLTGSGTISSSTTATTQSAGTNNTTIATTAFVTTAVASGSLGVNGQIFTSNGTFTIPANVNKVKVIVTGGGGNGNRTGGGGAGGTAIKWLTGLTPGNTLAVTVGGQGATSSVASGTQTISTVSATGGSNGSGAAGGSGGVGSGGDLNLQGGGGQGLSGVTGDSAMRAGGVGGSSYWGGAGVGGDSTVTASQQNGGNYGGGGAGGPSASFGGSAGGTGAGGVVVFEW